MSFIKLVKGFSGLFLCMTVLLGCQQAPVAQMPLGEDVVWHLVTIGDSSFWGLGKALAAKIEEDIGVKVVVSDFSIGGLSAGRVLTFLDSEGKQSDQLAMSMEYEKGRELIEALKNADVVVMFANPLSSIDPNHPLDLEACFYNELPQSCEMSTFNQWTKDLKKIWAEIIRLRDGKPTIMRATDLYNPLVVPWQENDVFNACNECWENMSDATRKAAEAYDIPFVSRLDGFNGIDHTEDPREKGYTQIDGEHPTELAAQYTAELLSELGYEPVQIKGFFVP